MKIITKVSILLCAVFAIACFSVAIKGFMSLGEIDDPIQQGDAWGYSWYWAFLGLIATLFGVVGYWLVKTQKDDDA